MEKNPKIRRTFLMLYGLLLVLLALSMASTLLEWGSWEIALRLGIAGVMAALMAIVFMHLRAGSPLVKLVASAGLFWIAVMFTLTFADYMSR